MHGLLLEAIHFHFAERKLFLLEEKKLFVLAQKTGELGGFGIKACFVEILGYGPYIT